MSAVMKDAMRRARLRELAGPPEGRAEEEDTVDRRRVAELYEAAGPPEHDPRPEAHRPFIRPRAHVLELTDEQSTELERLCERGYGYARELVNCLDGCGRISETATWNARDALEDDTHKSWPSKIPGASLPLARKLTTLFNEVPA